ncbi:phosphoglycerate mutase-like protein [Lindgomyces ingoldianus]|uniref:Phosphoglycerate mutase-like protein n=1 Tax=Lindgomyces ingoldianus TaxID=673940 RepID=A0ACB6QFD4_9PLEO|nr:phosphoglycerate mutase-like protein [Lindgomyces ingoldianus]KAF2465072.1 phosphoglycerate mutase-like protein [Lindgomyces ingoldianus]
MLVSGSLLVLLGGIASPSIAETVHGVLVFTRHGDRTSKHYSGYGLTSLGFEQNFQVGSSYRSRYLSSASPRRIFNISEDKYVPSQIYASAPDQSVLINTATAFLQGFYPPLGGVSPKLATQTLNNGTATQNPLNGYQYVFLHGADANSPDTIWLKGDDACPALTNASESFENSTEFQAKLESTKAFYAGFWDFLKGVYDYTPQKMTYAKAFDIFDLINVANIHNSSIPRNITSEELFQLRTLADSAEFAYNFNASQPARSIGGKTLTGAILNQLNQTVTTKGKLKFSLLAGSYDSFLAFFGLSNLISASTNFYGLPDYASTMAFELFTPENTTAFPSDVNALSVRFLFHNGSAGSLDTFPLFGRSENTTPWPEFVTQMKSRAITNAEQWCQTCNSPDDFCALYRTVPTSVAEKSKGGMSNAMAGVIGAMVMLGVVAICGILAFVLFWRRKKEAAVTTEEKASVASGSVSV